MMASSQRFQVHDGEWVAARLPPDASIPAWVSGSWTSVTRTRDELSIFAPANVVPPEVKQEPGWRLIEVKGPFSFSTVGVIAALAAPLAAAGVSVLTVATFDTDYLLVRVSQLDAALTALRSAGHQQVTGAE